MSDTASAQRPTAEIQDLDPRTLLVDSNIRTDLQIDADFVASLKDFGVLVPIVAVRSPEGAIRVRFGNRRTVGAIEAGLPTVPVRVVADEATDTAAEIERILTQYHENTMRAGITRTEEISVVAALFDLGVSAAQIAKRTRMDKADVVAAKKVIGSDLAKAATARYDFLTLDQAATLAEFDDDPEAVKALVAAAQSGPVSFEHVISSVRAQSKERAALAEAHRAYKAAGLTIVEQLGWANQLSYLRNGEGDELTEENHRNCPGHAAWLDTNWVRPVDYEEEDDDDYDEDGYSLVVGPVYVCVDPEANGHVSKYPTAQAKPKAVVEPEEAKAARRKVIENNKAWRAAETVRREWLTAFLARKTLPKGALRYVLTELAVSHWRLTNQLGANEVACQLLGVADKEALVTAINAAGDGRAQVIALAVILGAYEHFYGSVDTWRNSTLQDRAYLAKLIEWGYEPSDVERTIFGEEVAS
jgi:ParB family transcriptional regulator, chromosome partitioning protein